MSERRGFTEFLAGPSTAVMDRLRYAAKFGLIGALLIIPISVLSTLSYRAQSDQVIFNWKEHLGMEYAAPLKKFLFEVQRHRIVNVGSLTGERSFESTLGTARSAADKAAAEVTALDSAPADKVGMTYGKLLQTTVKWAAIREKWDEIKEQTRFPSAQAADAQYEILNGMVIDLLLNYVANYSNLILDPDLDSYWLMDAYTGKLPTIASTIAKATTLGLLPPEEGKLQARQLELAAAFKATTGTMSDLHGINLATAFKETVNPANENRGDKADLQPNLQGPAEKAAEAVNVHAETIKTSFLASGPTSIAQNRDGITKGLAALASVYALYDKVTPELDWLILNRMTNRYERPRTVGVILTLATMFLLVFLFSGFFFSVRGSIAAIDQATVKMIAGTTDVFVPKSKDELGSVLLKYNQINAALNEARTLRQQVETSNAELQENIVDMLDVVSNASAGDLTVRAKVTAGSLGNVADAFNQLCESLQALIGEIKKQQSESNEVVKKMRATFQTMASGATTQASELTSASVLIEKMSTEIERVSENARSAAEAAKRTEASAVDGSKNVDDVINGMEQLRNNVQSGTKKMKSLGDRSMEISTIVSVINRISEQTNMLALNAAIEAARAGEHGRGFSVVAEEVRKLAERTALATQEIEKLVKAIQSETSETVSAMEVQTDVVEKEVAIVGQAGASLNRIRQVSTESSGLVAEISKVAQNQVADTKSVVKVISQISVIAQETQAGALGTAQAMAGMSVASEQLAASIGRFKLS